MSAYLDWHVGMPVVCVRRVDYSVGPHKAQIEIGSTYTISAMEARSAGESIAGVSLDKDYLFVTLTECGGNQFYDAELFRPVQTRATDISIFTQLLNPSKVSALDDIGTPYPMVDA